jgi:hypothetical protein
VSVIVWYRRKLQFSPDIFKPTMLLVLDDLKVPSHGIGSYAQSWIRCPVSHPA